MSFETSQKILKVFGIIDIVLGVLGILVGILAIAGGGVLSSTDDGMAALAVVSGVIMIVAGIVSLLQGIFSVKAAKDSSKIMPAWIFAIIGLVMSAVQLISSISNGSSVVSAILSLAVSALIFVAANTIKKEA